MTSGHRWAFKTRFRASAYGWHGSALASKRLEEAVREINSVAKSDRVSAADGCVSLMERLWPALEHIDTSSGALGGAVHRTLTKLWPENRHGRRYSRDGQAPLCECLRCSAAAGGSP